MELINALSSPETQMNGNFQTLEWAQVYGRRVPVTTGLTWGYYGGVLWSGIAVADGTLTLTNAAANYIVVDKTSGAISVSTAATNWDDTAAYARVYKVTTAAGVVSAVEDHRAGAGGLFGGGGGGGAVTVADTLPTLKQGEQWYESDTGGIYMRYVNPDATETLIAMSAAGGDFIATGAKGQPNGVPSLDANGTIPATQLPPVNATNRIINGKFAIDQRNAGAAVDVGRGPDRWATYRSGAGVFTIQREADASYPGDYRLKITVTTGASSLASGDIYEVYQVIEGINVADFYSGTANAQKITMAFEVEATITGTFSVTLTNGTNTRSYAATFTVGAANTREQKTITLTADTIGAWTTDNGGGLNILIGLAAGSTNQTVPNVWTTGAFVTATGTTNFMATAGNTMRLKNVRLYKGSVDFGPDERLYAEELALCQRYFQCFNPDGATIGLGSLFRAAVTGLNWQWLNFMVPMRAGTPTLGVGTPTYGGGASGAVAQNPNSTGLEIAFSATAVGNTVYIPWTASAEL